MSSLLFSSMGSCGSSKNIIFTPILSMFLRCWEWVADLNRNSCVEKKKNKNLTWQRSSLKAISRSTILPKVSHFNSLAATLMSTGMNIGKRTAQNKGNIGSRNSKNIFCSKLYELPITNKKTFFLLRSLQDIRLVKSMILKKVVLF